MPFVLVDEEKVLYDEKTEQVAMFISRKAANLALSDMLDKLPDAEVIQVNLEKKQ